MITWTLPFPWLVTYWKPVTFTVGLLGLIYGAIFWNYQDWDIPLSVFMACAAYLSADRLVNAIMSRNLIKIIILLPMAWLAVDGSYWLYWHLVDTTVMIRQGQWPASACLYLLCGFVWGPFRPEIGSIGLHLHPTSHGQSDQN